MINKDEGDDDDDDDDDDDNYTNWNSIRKIIKKEFNPRKEFF